MIQFSVISTHMGFPKKDRLLERFIQYQEVERSASPRTIIAYRHALLRFKEFRDVTWDAATPGDFRLFLLECMKSGMARSYVRLTFAALRSFYRFLTERAGFGENPLKEVQLPKLEKKLPVVLSVNQVYELLTQPRRSDPKNQPPTRSAPPDTSLLDLF